MIEFLKEDSEFWKKISKLEESRDTFYNSTVAMEECAELIQAVSKLVRGLRSDAKINDLHRFNLLEEMADVIICVALLQLVYAIPDKELNAMLELKMDRNLKRLKKGNEENSTNCV